jgi:hypothetical protein
MLVLLVDDEPVLLRMLEVNFCRVRRDRIDSSGGVTVRHDSRLRHINCRQILLRIVGAEADEQ